MIHPLDMLVGSPWIHSHGADYVVRLPNDIELERPIPLQPKTFSRGINQMERTCRYGLNGPADPDIA